MKNSANLYTLRLSIPIGVTFEFRKQHQLKSKVLLKVFIYRPPKHLLKVKSLGSISEKLRDEQREREREREKESERAREGIFQR